MMIQDKGQGGPGGLKHSVPIYVKMLLSVKIFPSVYEVEKEEIVVL